MLDDTIWTLAWVRFVWIIDEGKCVMEATLFKNAQSTLFRVFRV